MAQPAAWVLGQLVTTLAGLILLSFIALMAWLQFSGSRVDGVEEPERALALIVGRTMDIDEAVGRAPSWEQRVYHVLSTDPAPILRTTPSGPGAGLARRRRSARGAGGWRHGGRGLEARRVETVNARRMKTQASNFRTSHGPLQAHVDRHPR